MWKFKRTVCWFCQNFFTQKLVKWAKIGFKITFLSPSSNFFLIRCFWFSVWGKMTMNNQKYYKVLFVKSCRKLEQSRSKWAQKAGLNGPKIWFFCFFLKTCRYIHIQILKNNYFSLVLQVLYCPVKFGLKSTHVSQLMSCKSTHVSSPINSFVGF